MGDDVTPGVERASGERGIGRRAVLCGGAGAAGAAVLAGCAGGGGATPAADLKGEQIAKAADIPVGGGKVYGDRKVVVTQPTQGAFKAFTAVCTHQGCTVGGVAGGLINCPCHGSEFAIADGSVRRGPAKEPLKEYPVQVKGGAVVVT
ncbi:Rieske (2Fe-2S) protein [Actinomadura madurae]|uniref:Rieske (2Fe-2S) protein n=1 Tax=Actinomadura madurae TaxID=1993 RepID=UPI002025E47B|nr:Rieske (2Fe-2S) protein [Actinomadura madurae]MCP9977234.1 Rieske (2Fe-2S) protein [Actinomadura madurae]MCQ0011258.1 Rieske (2Fe-2S) protein [Actinomadura madurae]URM93649.1 Rieske (2Fe-2S) protein [Actinomadura madurae]